MKNKTLIIILVISTLLLTSCIPQPTTPNASSIPSTSTVESDRTEEYVEMVRGALIEVYDYDIDAPKKEYPDLRKITYNQNLTDEFASKKEHKFKKDFKRITFDLSGLALTYIEFFEFTDQKDFDRCVDWLTLRQEDEYFSHAEVFYSKFPYVILTNADDLENQNKFLEIMEEKLD